MNQGFSVWVVIVASVLAANLPFITRRVLLVVPLKRPKSFVLRLAEWLAYYLMVGVLALSLEQRAGQMAMQGWEFYVITLTLFLVFGFPGFTYCYLYKPRQ